MRALLFVEEAAWCSDFNHARRPGDCTYDLADGEHEVKRLLEAKAFDVITRRGPRELVFTRFLRLLAKVAPACPLYLLEDGDEGATCVGALSPQGLVDRLASEFELAARTPLDGCSPLDGREAFEGAKQLKEGPVPPRPRADLAPLLAAMLAKYPDARPTAGALHAECAEARAEAVARCAGAEQAVGLRGRAASPLVSTRSPTDARPTSVARRRRRAARSHLSSTKPTDARPTSVARRRRRAASPLVSTTKPTDARPRSLLRGLS